jgi:aryl-alcohol dehydrogenase-like predicted oxidoreductase
MEKRVFGDTGMEITPLGFGAWAVGGEWAFGWGPQDDQQSVAAIRRAVELGMNWIDTAAVYGLGHSEEVVSKALTGVEPRPYVFTKCSQVWDSAGKVTTNLDPVSIRKECEASLRRLKVDVIDLYQIHWPQDEMLEQGWEMMARLKEEGKVKYIGVSNFSVSQLERVMRIAPVSTLQPNYSMINRKNEPEVLPFCLKHNIGVIAYSPMGAGLLTGAMSRERFRHLPATDWRHRANPFQEPAFTRNLEIQEFIRDIGKQLGVPTGVIALAWVLRNPAVTGAIAGGRNAAQVEGIIAAMDFRLGREELKKIEHFLTEAPMP